jgi:hypothetical protein
MEALRRAGPRTGFRIGNSMEAERVASQERIVLQRSIAAVKRGLRRGSRRCEWLQLPGPSGYLPETTRPSPVVDACQGGVGGLWNTGNALISMSNVGLQTVGI